MIVVENQCVGCPKELGCLGSSCPNLNVLTLYCDCCGQPIENFEDAFLVDEDSEKIFCETCAWELLTEQVTKREILEQFYNSPDERDYEVTAYNYAYDEPIEEFCDYEF